MRLPVTEETGVTQERIGWPSTCTVQAPHSAMPQPNFVPVRPRWSRSVQRSGVSGATSAERALPLTLRVTIGTPDADHAADVGSASAVSAFAGEKYGEKRVLR